MASGPISSLQIDGETMDTVTDFTSWTPKSLPWVLLKLRSVIFGTRKLLLFEIVTACPMHLVPEYFGLQSVRSDQIRSVAQSCPTLCDPMNRSMPGLPVQHQLLEFTQTHVHRVSDAVQPSHPLSSPSPPAPNPSQHQSLFQ